MRNLQYTTLDSVLFYVSTLIPEEHFNPLIMKEWALKALRKMKFRSQLETTVAILPVLNHKAKLPSDAKFLNQILWWGGSTTDVTTEDLQTLLGLNTTYNENSSIPSSILALAQSESQWKPMLANTNDFLLSITDLDVDTDGYCEHSYTIDPSLCITTTLDEGTIMVSYVRYAANSAGEIILPDNEDVKDAIMHFCLYNYWMSRATALEQGAERREDRHLLLFQTLAQKATGDENMPSADQWENIKRKNTLLPNSRAYLDSFQQLNRE
jgi:hypothetical protein